MAKIHAFIQPAGEVRGDAGDELLGDRRGRIPVAGRRLETRSVPA
jgi:hypothetical protein